MAEWHPKISIERGEYGERERWVVAVAQDGILVDALDVEDFADQLREVARAAAFLNGANSVLNGGEQ